MKLEPGMRMIIWAVLAGLMISFGLKHYNAGQQTWPLDFALAAVDILFVWEAFRDLRRGPTPAPSETE